MATTVPSRLVGEGCFRWPPLRRHGPEACGSSGWGDSNSGPPPQAPPSSGYISRLTCDSLLPVMTAPARCIPLPAGSLCTQRVPVASGPSGRGRLGASVLRDKRTGSADGHCIYVSFGDHLWIVGSETLSVLTGMWSITRSVTSVRWSISSCDILETTRGITSKRTAIRVRVPT
jgi:hypothetical protein